MSDVCRRGGDKALSTRAKLIGHTKQARRLFYGEIKNYFMSIFLPTYLIIAQTASKFLNKNSADPDYLKSELAIRRSQGIFEKPGLFNNTFA